MDVAKDFANPEVYLMVKNKWDSLAPDKDSKGAKKRPTGAVKHESSTSYIDVRETFKVTVVETAVDSLSCFIASLLQYCIVLS